MMHCNAFRWRFRFLGIESATALTLLLALAVSTPANAVPAPGSNASSSQSSATYGQFSPADLPRSGTQEIGLSGLLELSPINSNDIALLYGPFLTRNFQLAADVEIDHNGLLDGQQYGIEPNWYFPGMSVVEPYIGLFYGGAHTSGPSYSLTSVDYGGQAGVKFFVTPNLALTTSLEYREPEHSGTALQTTQLLLGVSTYLSPRRSGNAAAAVTAARPPRVPSNPLAGRFEVGITGLEGINPSGDFDVALLYGPFVTPTFQVAVEAGSSKQGTFRDTTYGIEPNVYFPNTSPFIPYLGGFVGGDDSTQAGGHYSSLALGAQGGALYFINANVALNTGISVRRPVQDSIHPINTLTELDLGLSLFLPR